MGRDESASEHNRGNRQYPNSDSYRGSHGIKHIVDPWIKVCHNLNGAGEAKKQESGRRTNPLKGRRKLGQGYPNGRT